MLTNFALSGQSFFKKRFFTSLWRAIPLKNLELFERLEAQFRLKATNAFNTPIFRLTNAAFGNVNFGKITLQANFPRTVQVSVRLFW